MSNFIGWLNFSCYSLNFSCQIDIKNIRVKITDGHIDAYSKNMFIFYFVRSFHGPKFFGGNFCDELSVATSKVTQFFET